jgi:AcrR family transcriptional regulator
MLYHYFGSKLKLYVAVITTRWHEAMKECTNAARAALEDGDPLIALEVLTSTYFDFWQARPRYARLIRWEAASEWAVIKRVDRTIPGQLYSVVSEILERGKATGQFADVDSRIVRWMILGLISHYYFDRPLIQTQFEAMLTSPEIVRHHREEVVRFICRAVRA